MKRICILLTILMLTLVGADARQGVRLSPTRDSLGLGQRARVIFRSIRTATGTADAPAYSFETEDNTGMFLHEPSVVAWSLNGIRRLSLNVCNILTGTMLNLVTPNNSELTGIRFFSKNAGGDDRHAGIFNIPDVPALIFSGNAADPHMLIKPEGTVAIATTTPDLTKKLHVVGNTRVDGTSTTDELITGGSIHFNIGNSVARYRKYVVQGNDVASITLAVGSHANTDVLQGKIKVSGFSYGLGGDAGTGRIFEKYFTWRRRAGANVVLEEVGGIGIDQATISGGGAGNVTVAFAFRRTGGEGVTETQASVLEIKPSSTSGTTTIWTVATVEVYGYIYSITQP